MLPMAEAEHSENGEGKAKKDHRWAWIGLWAIFGIFSLGALTNGLGYLNNWQEDEGQVSKVLNE